MGYDRQDEKFIGTIKMLEGVAECQPVKMDDEGCEELQMVAVRKSARVRHIGQLAWTV